jgi:hypothetical protein
VKKNEYWERKTLVDCDVAEMRKSKGFDEYNAVSHRIPSFHLSGDVGKDMIPK